MNNQNTLRLSTTIKNIIDNVNQKTVETKTKSGKTSTLDLDNVTKEQQEENAKQCRIPNS